MDRNSMLYTVVRYNDHDKNFYNYFDDGYSPPINDAELIKWYKAIEKQLQNRGIRAAEPSTRG